MIDLVDTFEEKYGIPEQLEWMGEVSYVMPETMKEAKRLLLSSWDGVGDVRVGVDTETTGLDTTKVDLVGVSISPEKGVACYLPVAHKKSKSNLPWPELSKLLEKFLEPRIGVFYNALFDNKILHRHGVGEYKFEDAMVAVYLSNVSDKGFTQGLKASTLKLLEIKMLEFWEVVGAGNAENYSETDPRLSGAYAAADADMTLRLLNHLKEYWWDSKKNEPTFIWKLENQVIDVLEYMEGNTVLLNQDLIERYIQGALRDLLIREQLIYSLAGESFDIASPQQVAKVVFKNLGVKSSILTPKGKMSTGRKALEACADQHPVISHIEAYRVIQKNVYNYLLKLLTYCVDNDPEGRFHLNSVLAPSGRLSSDSGGKESGYTPMNIQNITSSESFRPCMAREVLNADDFFDMVGVSTEDQPIDHLMDKVRANMKIKRKVKKRGKGDLDGNTPLF